MRTVRSIVCLLVVCLLASSAMGAPLIRVRSPVDDVRVTVTYECSLGRLAVNAPPGSSLTSFSLKSKGGFFNIDNIADPGNFSGLFDVLSADQMFKLSPAPNDFSSLVYGDVYRTGMTFDEILADLDASGSMQPSGKAEELGDPSGVGFWVCPEPASLTLVCIGLLGLIKLRRR